MEFGTFSFTIFGGYKKGLDPKNTHTNNLGGIKSFQTPPKFIIYKPNIKSGFSLQPFIWQEIGLYFLVGI